MKKSLIALGLTLAISSFSAYAQRHQQPHHQHHPSITAINLVIAAVDESNAANLQTQLDTIECVQISALWSTPSLKIKWQSPWHTMLSN